MEGVGLTPWTIFVHALKQKAGSRETIYLSELEEQ